MIDAFNNVISDFIYLIYTCSLFMLEYINFLEQIEFNYKNFEFWPWELFGSIEAYQWVVLAISWYFFNAILFINFEGEHALLVPGVVIFLLVTVADDYIMSFFGYWFRYLIYLIPANYY